jgi:hypothetical protein
MTHGGKGLYTPPEQGKNRQEEAEDQTREKVV